MKEKNVDNAVAAGGCLFIIVWFVSVLLSLGLTGVIIWAIIELVKHYTS